MTLKEGTIYLGSANMHNLNAKETRQPETEGQSREQMAYVLQKYQCQERQRQATERF